MIQDVRVSLYQRYVIATDGQNIRATKQPRKVMMPVRAQVIIWSAYIQPSMV
jgi:hypothetical protein